MRPTSLSTGEIVVLASSVCLTATSFVPLWASYELTGRGAPATVAVNAWGHYGFGSNLALLLLMSAGALTILRWLGIEPEIVLREQAYALLAWPASALLFTAVVGGPAPLPASVVTDVARGPLAYSGVLLAVAAAYGSGRHLGYRPSEVASTARLADD